MIERLTSSAAETQALGAQIGRLLRPGDLALLYGDLGAGKTTLVQGIAEGLGIGDPVTSPTFTLVHEYPTGRIPLIHVDAYRLESEREIADLGFFEWLERDAAIVVEWAERLRGMTPADRLTIKI